MRNFDFDPVFTYHDYVFAKLTVFMKCNNIRSRTLVAKSRQNFPADVVMRIRKIYAYKDLFLKGRVIRKS